MQRRWAGLLFAVAVVEGSLAHARETQPDKIKRALSAAPHAIAKAAKGGYR